MKVCTRVLLVLGLFSLLAVGGFYFSLRPRSKITAPPVSCAATASDTAGPYYREGAPFRNNLVGEKIVGEHLVIQGTVYGPDCQTPAAQALIEVWQADDQGQYDNESSEYRLRGRFYTDERGRYEFQTVLPARYNTGSGFRPKHIHFKVSHPDHQTLTSQIYFADDCPSCHPSQTISLTSEQKDGPIRTGTFNIVLEGSLTK